MTETALFWPFAVMAAGAVATYAWRALGVALSGRIEPRGKLFEWIACIAYALLSALVARMILLPSGPLAEVPLSARAAAAILGLAVFFLSRRKMALGIASAVAVLMAASWAQNAGIL